MYLFSLCQVYEMNAIWNWLFLLSCAPADKSTAAQSFIIRAGFYFLFFEVDFVIKALSLYIYERLLISLMLLQLYSSLLCCVLSFHFPVYRAVKGLCPFFFDLLRSHHFRSLAVGHISALLSLSRRRLHFSIIRIYVIFYSMRFMDRLIIVFWISSILFHQHIIFFLNRNLSNDVK